MTLWNTVKAFLRREATELHEGLADLKGKLDSELTRREDEREASPSERLDMIRGDIESAGSPFEAIERKIDDRIGEGDAVEELRSRREDDPGDDR